MSKQRRFKLGTSLVSIAVLEVCRHGLDLGPYLERHASGDWGDATGKVIAENEDALRTGKGRIRSVFHMNGRRIWLVTEEDRSRTVALLPHEEVELD